MKKQTSAATETGNKSRTKIDFNGKIIHVGIDVHKKDWQVALFYLGVILGNYSINGNASELIDFLKKHYPGAILKCVYESCAWGFNLQRQLSAAGMECIVVHAGDIPGTDKEKKNKTDKVDAKKLARLHAAGLLDAIHVPDEELQADRNLVRYRKRLLGDLNKSKNRLKSLLCYQGIEIPAKWDNPHWSNNFMTWLEEQAITDVVVELMLEEVKMLRQLLLKTEKKLRELMKTEKYKTQTKLLTSVPGVGPKTSNLFVLEVGNIRRFKNFDALNCLVGFYSGSNSSGEKNIDTGITNRKHNQLRSLLVEAAWQAIRIDPALREAYNELKKRMKPNQAIIRIARKLLRRMRAVLLTGKEYEKGLIK